MVESKRAASAQAIVEVKEIRDGVIVLRNGGLRKVVTVTGVNFDLKSQEEQEIILNTFQDFLNSLSFTTQIFIHSRKLNVDAYLDIVNTRLEEEQNELLRNQLGEYREFIKSFVEQNAIMTKSYFIIVPFTAIQLPAGGSAASAQGFLSKFSKKKKAPQTMKEGDKKEAPEEDAGERSFREYVEQLDQRVSQVVNGLNRVGLRAVVLNEEELTELLYNAYNPETVEKSELEIAKPEHASSQPDGKPHTKEKKD